MDQAWLDELAEFVRIPSVSADASHAADVVAAAEWVAGFVRDAGGGAELVPWGERPLVVGEISASNGAASAPTVLLYGHFDVQPPAPLNAAHALAKTLAGVLPRDGRAPEPLRRGIVPPTEEELASWRELPPGGDELESQGARPADPAAAEEFYLRTFAEPALDVNGIETGSPHLQKTVLPVVAEANVSIRLAPGQRPDEIGDALDQLLREAAPEGAELEIQHWTSSRSGLVPPDAKAIQLGLDAFERAMGKRPLLVRSGGTLPIVPALADKRIPAIVTGFAVPDSNIHSPNERILVEYLPLAVRAATELYLSFAKL